MACCALAISTRLRARVPSSLPDTEKLSNGQYKVDHFTGKAKVEERIRELRRQGRFESAVFVRPAFYWQNIAGGYLKPIKQDDGSYAYLFPVDPARTPVAGLDITDFGPIVAKIMLDPKQYDGRDINIASETLTFAQMAEIMAEGASRPAARAACMHVGRAANRAGMHRSIDPRACAVSGKRVIAKEISEDDARRAGVSQELIDMYKWFRDRGLYNGEPIDPLCKQFHPQMKDFRTFLRSNDDWRELFA